MEFRHTTLTIALALLPLAAFNGCSSSDGNVDYASIDNVGSADDEATQANDDWQSDTSASDVVAEDNATADESSSPAGDALDTQDKSFPQQLTTDNKGTELNVPSDSDGVKMVSNAETTTTTTTSVQVAVASVDSADAGEPQKETPAESQPTLELQGNADEEASAEPREIKLLIPDHRFRSEGDDGSLLRISYDDIDLLKVLNMEPVPVDAVDYFPQWLKDLDGQRIRLRGFMYPTFVATGIKNFGLARDNGICCFVKQPKIYDMIEVNLADNESTDYIEGKPFDVEGTFRIDPDADDTELFQLYRIEDARVLKP